MDAMRLYPINPSDPLVSIIKVKESRWNRYGVWKPLSLMVLGGLTSPEWEITIVDENLGEPDYPAMPRPDLVELPPSPRLHFGKRCRTPELGTGTGKQKDANNNC
jgi:hypothetical protein